MNKSELTPSDLSFSKHDLETILYSLEGYIQCNNDLELADKLVDICYKLECILEEDSDDYNAEYDAASYT